MKGGRVNLRGYTAALGAAWFTFVDLRALIFTLLRDLPALFAGGIAVCLQGVRSAHSVFRGTLAPLALFIATRCGKTPT